MNEKKDNIERLKAIISEFDNHTWNKMATKTDFARFVVERGFYPSTNVKKYQVGIAKVITTMENLLENGDNCGLSSLETISIIDMLKSISKGA